MAAWRLAAPFFVRGPHHRSACAIAILTLLLNLLVVGLGIVMSYWRNEWYSALQAHDWPRFVHLLFYPYVAGPNGFMPGFIGMAALMIGLSTQAVWLRQWLQIRWRTEMTQHFLAAWRAARTPAAALDNPDQRIADDLRYFTEDALLLALDLVTATASAAGYIIVLWRLSGTIMFAGLHLHGSMVFAALLYAVFGTWLTHLVGRRLAVLDGLQQRKEADFRFRLMRERPDASGPDHSGGGTLGFDQVAANFRAIMDLSRLVRLLTRSYNQVADIFPLLVAAPRYFAGAITLGALLQIADSFAQVQEALSWFVNNYTSLADLRATIRRLDGFAETLH